MPNGLLHLVQLHQLGSSHPSSWPGILHCVHEHICQFCAVPLGTCISRSGGPVVLWGETNMYSTSGEVTEWWDYNYIISS